MTTTPDPPLSDDDISTEGSGLADLSLGGKDADGTDVGSDADGSDGSDADGSDGADADGADTSDSSDTSDADGSDAASL
jgi:hypothetical protein